LFRDGRFGVETPRGEGGEIFRTPRPALENTQFSIQWETGLSGVKNPERGVDRTLTSGTEVEERV